MIRAIRVFLLPAALCVAAAPRGLIETTTLALAQTAQRPGGTAESKPAESSDFSGSASEVYRREGKIELKVHIFAPPGHQQTDRRAAIVFFFGGGWRAGSVRQFVPQCRHLAERGMVAIAADYRVYDRHQAKVADCVSDAQAAVRWVRANAGRLGIDPHRIAAGGGSAGGHLAAATAMLRDFTGEKDPRAAGFRPDALVLFNPALDLTRDSPAGIGDTDGLQGILSRLGADPKDLSPADHIRPGLPPVIIFHGRDDRLIPYAQMDAFTDAMRKAGNRCELVGFQGQGHGFFNRGESFNATLVQAERFLRGLGYFETRRPVERHEAGDVEAIRADAQFFTDGSCSRLKPGVRPDDLARFRSDLLRKVAAALLDGTYDGTHRAAGYEAYPSPRALNRTLKLGNGFSRYENITGIYLEAGDHVVLVGSTAGKELSLLIPDWMRKPPEGIEPAKDPDGWGLRRQEIRLEEGVNVIHVQKSGNAYVSYFDDPAEKAPRISVHFPTGKVNGFFDASKHTNADWDRLLDQAVSPIMDARGAHIQVAYPVEWFRVYTRGKGVELIRNYDTMLRHHYTLMGLVKHGKVPRNRILARVNFNYYMFRDRDGVAYMGDRSTMRMVADPGVVTVGDPCWGFCHEVGHVLQMRQFTWGGMTEVSNNIFSMYTVGQMGNQSRLKAQKNYASARKNIIEAEPKKSFLDGTDVFDRLVPFWQLHLYFSRNGRPDFYADVMEQMRGRPDAGSGDDSIRNQFEFVKICCDVAELDLTDFFEQWGFFWVGNLTVEDYGIYRYAITREMVDETKAYIAGKQYRKPEVDIAGIEE